MVTGDIQATAVAIAKEASIIPYNFELSMNEYVVMDGINFRTFVGGLK